MEWYEALFLGIIQGLTEFLPISSSGHLVLFSHIFGVENTVGFDVAVHVGTLFSVLVFYRKKLIEYLKSPWDILKKLILATIPAAFVMLLFGSDIERLFSVKFLPVSFFISAIILFITDRLKGEKQLSFAAVVSSGAFQALAVLPGVTRSGSTIFGARLLGTKREEAVDFSFLMSIPVIAGSAAVMLLKGDTAIEPYSFCIGGVAAFLFGLLSIKLTVQAVKKAKMSFFALYLAILSVALTVYNLSSLR